MESTFQRPYIVTGKQKKKKSKRLYTANRNIDWGTPLKFAGRESPIKIVILSVVYESSEKLQHKEGDV